MSHDGSGHRPLLSRRSLLRRAAALGSGALAAKIPAWAQQPGGPALELLWLTMRAESGVASIRPGPSTAVWQYVAHRKGRSTFERANYIGPILRVGKGAYVDVDFTNALAEPTTVHWHGLDVPPAMDGHPIDMVEAGGRFRYGFRVLNRAGTYWFHPHPDMRTGPQVYQGLSGVVIVSDPEEQALGLPRGGRDKLFVVQDRFLDAANQFVYAPVGMSGLFGDQVLVNGHLGTVQAVQTAAYRLRFLNGCNGRILKLAWSDGSPVTIIGSEAGLLRSPESKPYVVLVPGERVEIWADFRGRKVGETITLRSLSFYPGMNGGGALPNGAPFDVMRFYVESAVADKSTLPGTLSNIPQYLLKQAANILDPRVIPLSKSATEWKLNGASFQMTGVAPNEITRLGALEVWEFQNDAGGQMMAHPMHLHGSPFQIAERTVSPAYQAQYDSVKDGLVDSGWKDTFLIMPGERVKILTKPLHHAGRFLYHCHNLEHEDMGMMRNYDVLA